MLLKANIKRILAAATIAASTVFLWSGCSLLSPVPMSKQSYYAITSDSLPIATPSSSTKRTLLISLPTASPGYQSADMRYVDTPYQLKSFATHRWVAPPASLLLPLFAQCLRAQAYFHAVLTPPFSGLTDVHLDTQLLTLQQEFLRPISVVRLVLQATLSDSSDRVLASRRFQALVEARGNNPYSGVLATNKAASLICQSLSEFTVQTMRANKRLK